MVFEGVVFVLCYNIEVGCWGVVVLDDWLIVVGGVVYLVLWM